MKDPKIKTRVVHSQTKPAWNIIGVSLGGKYKIARVPYIVTDYPDINHRNQTEALQHAMFISYCFNNSNQILQ